MMLLTVEGQAKVCACMHILAVYYLMNIFFGRIAKDHLQYHNSQAPQVRPRSYFIITLLTILKNLLELFTFRAFLELLFEKKKDRV